jgi:catechol 2,3-dioxygenase-like lactoylglutathione lyase family enzyme
VIGAPVPQLRVARPSRNLRATVSFYTRSLGLEVLDAFVDHAGFDGVILGRAGWPYHLEVTRRRAEPIVPRPTTEDLLVFYFPDHARWRRAVRRLLDAGVTAVRSENPYWDRIGLTFVDPDGYRLVLANADWPPAD